MEKCPHCGEILSFIAPVVHNCEIYGNPVNGVTQCCGNIVRVSRVITFAYSIPVYHQSIKHDDWLNKNKGYKE